MSGTGQLPELESLRTQLADVARELAERDHRLRQQTGDCDRELQDLRAQSQLLLSITQGTAWESGEDFFASLVNHLTSTMQVQYAVIGEVLNDRPQTIRTVAVSSAGGPASNFVYPLAQTPCETVLTQSFACFERHVQDIFPRFTQLRQLGAESYCGVPIRTKAGAVIGILAILDTKPLRNTAWLQSVMTAFAARTGAELQRQRAERRLRFTQCALDHAVDAVLWTDAAGHIIYANDAACRSLGYLREELLGLRIADIAPHHDPEHFQRRSDALGQAGSATYESVHRRKDGTEFPVEVSVTYLEHEGSGYACGIIRDITERTRIERERHQALADLQNIMETVPDIMFTLDAGGNLIRWNGRLVAVTGYKPEELLNKPALTLVPVEEQTQTAEAIQRAFIEGRAEFDGHLLTRTGHTIPYRWTGAVLRDSSGRIIGITGIGRDVSEQTRAQVELTQQRQHLLESQALAHLGSCEWDLASDEMAWSDEQFRIFGHAPHAISITHDTFLTALLPDDHDRVLAAMNDALLGNAPYDVECRIVRPTGEIRTIHCRGTVTRSPAGHPVRMSGTVLDITDRKQIEEALRVSEERWHLAIHGSNDGIWDWNIQGREIFFSTRWKTMRGFADHEITNHIDEWRSRIHPDDLDRVLQSIDRYLAKQTSVFCEEYRVQRKDESYMWILDRGAAIWAEDGSPLRMAGSESDITERKRAEEALAQSRDLLASFVAHTPAAVAMLDKDFRYLAVSQRWLQDYRLGDQNLIGKHHYDVFPEIRHMTEWHTIHQRCLAGSVERRDEDRFVREDGSEDWLRWEIRPWHDVSGEISGIIMFTEVITERKRAEEALRTSQEKLQQALRASHTGLWDWNTDTNETALSRELKHQLGYDEAELSDTFETWETRLHPEDRDRVMGYVRAYLANPQGDYQQEFRLRHKDGTYRWIEARAAFVTEPDGRRVRLLGSHTDVTERKQIEDALCRSKAQLSDIMENHPAVVYTRRIGDEWPFTFVTPNIFGLLGYTSIDVISDAGLWDNLMHPDDLAKVMAQTLPSFLRKGVETFVTRLRHQDGQYRWIENQARLTHLGDGPLLMVGTMTDITERIRAEDALRESEERFRAVVESASNGLVMVDGDGRIVLLNRQIERLFGYRRDDLLGRPIEILIPHRFRTHHPILRAEYQKTAETTKPVRGRELYGMRQDGGEFPIDIELTPIKSGNGPMTLASVTDLTERTRAEDQQKQLLAELAESQKHFEQIFHWTPSAVAISTLAEGRFLDVNDRLVQLTGYSREELIGHTTAELRLWADPPERVRVIQEILQQRSLHNKEGLLRTKSGELRTIMISVDRIQVQATPCLIYVAHDITERKQAEITQARQYEALQAIFRMTVALSHASSLEELYEQGIDGVQRALKVDRAAILLFDEDGVMRFKTSRGLSEEYKTAMEGHSPWSRQTVNPRPMLVEDVGTDPSVAPDRAIIVGEGIAALGFIPLFSSDGLVGQFLLYYDTPHQFTAEEIQIVQTIAGHIALLIQRKRAVETLRHSERQQRTVLDSLPIGVWFTDRTGKTLLANPAAKQIWSNIKHVGWQTQDNPSGWRETLESATEPHRWALGHTLTTGKSSLNETLDLEGLDGGKKTIRNTTVPVRDESGTVLGAVILNEDLTEIRRVQEALRLTQFSVDHAVEGFFWIGPDARILNVNDAVCRMLEYSREELMAMTVHDIDPHFQPELWPTHWEELKQKGSVTLESTQWSKTGRVLDIEITISYLRYTDREYHCAIMRDIGERKKTQCALRESEDRLQRALEANGAGTWRVDLHTRLDTRDTGLNRLLGLPADTTVQPVDEWFTFIHPDDRPAMEAAWQNASISDLYEVEHRLIRSDGAIRWVYNRGRFVRDEVGQPLYATGAVLDITERKQMEEALRQRERDLHAAIDERERISQDLHDGILQSLYAVGLGLEACKPLMTQRHYKKAVATMSEAIRQLNHVMSEVRNFIAGLESQVLQGNTFPAALQEMVNMLATTHPLRCTVSVDETAAEHISTQNALHLLNIVREALSNSLRHAQATKATITLKPLSRSIRLSIADNGIGFKPASMRGVGHGLTNMAARARKVGGRFAIKSVPQHGTRITIDLPKENRHAESEHGSTAARR